MPDGGKNLLVRGSLSVIHLDKFPPHRTLGIDNVSGWMRPSFAVRIEDPIAVNDFVVLILEKGEIVVAWKFILELLNEFLGIFVTVYADRQDLNFILLWFAQ